MYHSVYFGDKNTWTEWHLVATSRPVINPPAQKRKTIDIPGGNGIIDLSDSLTGYPVYENRQGSIEFIVVNDLYYQNVTPQEWYRVYSSILGYLHGQKMKLILEDEPEYYYYGTLSVNTWVSNPHHSNITIDYDLEPFKYRHNSILSDWKWDELNFETGVIPSNTFRSISLTTSSKTITVSQEVLEGEMPSCPVIDISTTSGNGARVRFVDATRKIDITKDIPEGGHKYPEFVFLGNDVTLYVRTLSGTGHISIDFKRGKL